MREDEAGYSIPGCAWQAEVTRRRLLVFVMDESKLALSLRAAECLLVAAEGSSSVVRPGIIDTPQRFAKAWAFWTSGYEQDPKAVLKEFEDGGEKYDEMVVVSGTPVFSHCEHHIAPIFGYAHVGYIPDGRVVGLSKISRLIEVFARRLQVQERMTVQIADALQEHLKPRGVGVILQCRHLCMESRGIQKMGTITTTSSLRGRIKEDPQTRAEFLSFTRSSV